MYKNLDQWVFCCDREGQWKAAKREHYKELWNNHKSEHVLRSSNPDTLVELISITNGDLNKINNLIQ